LILIYYCKINHK